MSAFVVFVVSDIANFGCFYIYIRHFCFLHSFRFEFLNAFLLLVYAHVFIFVCVLLFIPGMCCDWKVIKIIIINQCYTL